MSVIRHDVLPKRFERVYGGDFRRIALCKRKVKNDSRQLIIQLKESATTAGGRNDDIDLMVQKVNKETQRRLNLLDEKYWTIVNRYKQHYAGIEEIQNFMRIFREERRSQNKKLLSEPPKKEGEEEEEKEKEGTEHDQRPKNRFVDRIVLQPDPTIIPGSNHPCINNVVVLVHLGKYGNNLYVDQQRIPLYIPNSLKNNKFAASIIPQDGATVLFFSNGKSVMTGTTGRENALFALQMFRLTLSRVMQPMIVVDGRQESYEISYLKTILDFTGMRRLNTVCSGPIAKEGESVDLSAILETYPETNWNPEIFPGLYFHIPAGNTVIPGGEKVTAQIFEKRIVIMLRTHKNVNVAYNFFLKLVKPFINKTSSDYEEDRYTYRYKQMLWKLNAVNNEASNLNFTEGCGLGPRSYFSSSSSLQDSTSTMPLFVWDQGEVFNTVSIPIPKDKEEKDIEPVTTTTTLKEKSEEGDNFGADDNNIINNNSLFAFDFEDQLPPEILKKMMSVVKTGSKIKSLTH